MKNLKKFAALLLAGAMALLMLTACGGGGRAHQVQTAPAGTTSVSLLPPGLTALRQ